MSGNRSSVGGRCLVVAGSSLKVGCRIGNAVRNCTRVVLWNLVVSICPPNMVDVNSVSWIATLQVVAWMKGPFMCAWLTFVSTI